MGLDTAALFPSVRCGLESAFLSAIAQSQGVLLCDLLIASQLGGKPITRPDHTSTLSPEKDDIAVNGVGLKSDVGSPYTPELVHLNSLANPGGVVGEACHQICENVKQSGSKAVKVKQ